MKFSYAWLRSMIDPGLSAPEFGARLTMAGLEVESIEPAAGFRGVVVSQVMDTRPHAQSTRLQICTVDVGGRLVEIVCGAPNVGAGMKVPAALEGAQIPSGEILAASVRGVMSHGMLCSEKELGLGEDDSGLWRLPADAPIGVDLVDYLQRADDILTLKVTPNRADCLSISGMAREAAAVLGLPFKLPPVAPVPVDCESILNVIVEAPEACPLYCGRCIEGIDMGAQTPDWLRTRLERSGLRSVNAVVDVTNYVMLEMGQPLHAFDRDKIAEEIVVRPAASGEALSLLSGTEAELSENVLVIADRQRALAVAGIMGGSYSAVSETTQRIFLESAFFSPDAIVGRARQLGLATDSSFRFERGVDFGQVESALDRATTLILEICGGKAGKISRQTASLPARTPISLKLSRLHRLLGQTISGEQAEAYLCRLGMACERQDGGLVAVPPSFRFDLELDVDLIEEIARLHGYDTLPTAPPRTMQIMRGIPEARRPLDAIRSILVERDYQEVITYSFVDSKSNARFAQDDAIAVMNPIATQFDVMRSSLWVGLLNVLKTNLNQLAERVRIFESGRIFARGEENYQQTLRLAGLCHGPAFEEQWGIPSRSMDFFDVKADVEALLSPRRVETVATFHPVLHPGMSARICVDGKSVGWIGALHPALSMEFEVPEGVILFDLDVDALCEVPPVVYSEISRFPVMRRDLAVVVDESVTAKDLLQTMREAASAIVEEVKIFDIYRGKGIDSGKKSIAFRVVLKDTQKTLTDTEADAVVSTLLTALADRFNAKLRS